MIFFRRINGLDFFDANLGHPVFSRFEFLACGLIALRPSVDAVADSARNAQRDEETDHRKTPPAATVQARIVRFATFAAARPLRFLLRQRAPGSLAMVFSDI